MTLTDHPAVTALWHAAEGVGLSDADSEPGIQAYLARNPGMSAVAVLDGQIVGAVLCGHDGRRGYLHHLAVESQLRRKGIARMLLRFCFEQLGSHGVQKCNIFLFADNSNGEQFWLHNHWHRRDDLRVLQKPVAPSA